MSRFVSPVPVGARAASASSSANQFAENVVKYIPGEVLAAYLAINGILASVGPDQDPVRKWAWLGSFLICLFGTAAYFRKIAKPGDPTRVQIPMSMAAFVIWAYSIGGIFVLMGVHLPWLASILLILFSLWSGSVQPRTGNPPPAPRTPDPQEIARREEPSFP